ncbi:MAG: M42 family metallopeptidase [Chloroflexi bacterium]|nr:M42 family metallopeptidase [Chloroflexota bacterium]
MDSVQLLRELSQVTGVSGYEAEARDAVHRLLELYADEIRTDALGNLIALKRGASGAGNRRVMLAAHLDELGLMVTGVEQGFLRFTTVGGVDVRTIVGQEVTVHGRCPLSGIVASRPPHVVPAEERDRPVPLTELFIDVGLPAEQVSELVRVGDLITMAARFAELADGRVSGKAFDDRAGVASLVLCLEALASVSHTWDIYAVATSQEERGLQGAAVSAYGIAPQLALAVDVTFATQPSVGEHEGVALDGGPAIGVGPNIHPVIQRRLSDTAKRHEIKHQSEILPGHSGTDAWAIQVSRDGVPTGLLFIPLRYMHTSVETASVRDVDRTARLMARFVAELDDRFAEELGL